MSDLYTFDDDTDFDEVFGDLNLTMLHSGERHHVFVYGTLMSGMRNHSRLQVGGAKLYSDYGMIKGGYKLEVRRTSREYIAPVLIKSNPDDPTGVITGEIYDVDTATLSELDMFEGHPFAYRREKINVIFINEDGYADNKSVWTYIYAEEDHLLGDAQEGDSDAIEITKNDSHGHECLDFTTYEWKGEEL